MSNVKRYFDTVARSYAKHYTDLSSGYPIIKLRSEQSLDWLREKLVPRKSVVIDFGCGTGWLLELLSRAGFGAHGIDVSDGMIGDAKRRLAKAGIPQSRADAEVADLETWRAARAYDGALALGVFEYLPNDDMLFKAAARAMRPGGAFVVECRNKLVNLTSMNSYTAAVVRSGEFNKLLAEYEALQGHPALADFAKASKRLARAVSDAFSGYKGEKAAVADRVSKASGKFSKIVRRQHTPLGLAASAKRHGFKLDALRFMHPHPFPPALEKQAPLAFRRIGLAFEAVSNTPAAAVMSSSFMARFIKTRG